MLTKKEIHKRAQTLREYGEAPLFCGGFVEGAIWANEQNAQEIAELVEALRQIRSADIAQKINTGAFSIPQPLREKVQNLLSKYEE